MTINWPTTPALGAQVTGPRGEVWQWDGKKWIGIGGTTDAPHDGLIYGRRDGRWDSLNIPEIPEDISVVPVGGRLEIVGSSPASQIRYVPFNGGWIRIGGKDYALPGSGVVASGASAVIDGMPGQALVTNTFYYVYLFDDVGTLKIEFSTTGHITSVASGNVGTEVKIGNETRTLVGIAHISLEKFYDHPNHRCVRSWLNRKVTGFGQTGSAGCGNPNWVAVGPQSVIVNFAGEIITCTASGGWTHSGGGAMGVTILADGAPNVGQTVTAPNGQTLTITTSGILELAEGAHTIALGAMANPNWSTGAGTIMGIY